MDSDQLGRDFMEIRKGYNNSRYLSTLEMESIDEKGKTRFVQQPSAEICIELLKNKLRINELR